MKEFIFEHGDEVKDVVTNFRGIITGRADHITGCNTYGVNSRKLKSDGTCPENCWFDEDKLILIKKKKVTIPAYKKSNVKKVERTGGPREKHENPSDNYNMR
jgi:hypothetical protein